MVPTIDAAAFPIVLIRFGSALSHADCVQHYTNVRGLFDKHGPFISVADLNDILFGGVTAPVRRQLAQDADLLAAEGAFLAEFVAVRSSLTRSLFIIYAWLRRNKGYPMRCFDDIPGALQAAMDLLALRDEEPDRPVSSHGP